MNECVFCSIIKREVPATVVYENSKVLALLDINPISKGHTLIIPKKHFVDIHDIAEDYLKEVVVMAKKVSVAIKKSLGAEGINILQASGKVAQQSVFHFHLHLVPRFRNDGLNHFILPKGKYEEKDIKKVAEKIIRAIDFI